MSWTKFVRKDRFQGSEQSYISVRSSCFGFNSVFARRIGIKAGMRVSFFFNETDRKIGFLFLINGEQDSESLKLSAESGGTREGVHCSLMALVEEHPWIKSIQQLSRRDRRFFPEQDGKKWVIQLCPSFEHQVVGEAVNIPSDADGIYRCLQGKEIIYIGQGHIRERIRDHQRREWRFDVVEYSIVDGKEQREEWEFYWIERYKRDHNGELPHYNEISGKCKGTKA